MTCHNGQKFVNFRREVHELPGRISRKCRQPFEYQIKRLSICALRNMQISAKINYPKVAGGHRASYRLAKNLYSHRAQNRLASATPHSAFSADFAPPVLHRNSGKDSRKVETSCTETPVANGVLSTRNEKKIIFSFVFRSLIRNFAHKKTEEIG